MSKLSDMLNSIERKKLKAKISEALAMLKKGDTSTLVDKFKKADKTKLSNILSEISSPDNSSQLQQIKDELSQQFTKEDFDTFRQALKQDEIKQDEIELVDKLEDIVK